MSKLIHTQNNTTFACCELSVYQNTDGSFTVYTGADKEEWSEHSSLKAIISSYEDGIDF